ncbi:mediator of RNA polymerase II transcription subunit 15a-like isoform X2 [Elaeis guineensis]|uniref:mediator of RNA polymerase II transcription subunit 15a-like isoform X2 n=1 Tax=Elaeis guineensis var. tenera TaxID=51953 RepID=UPI003C6D20F3
MGYLFPSVPRSQAVGSSPMEGNSWRPAHGEPSATDAAAGDWRSQLQHDARLRIINKIMDTLKRHLPISVPEGLDELQKIAVRFEEKIYSRATSQSDYLRQISLKMLAMETKTQHTPPINLSMPNTTVLNQNATDPVDMKQVNVLSLFYK